MFKRKILAAITSAATLTAFMGNFNTIANGVILIDDNTEATTATAIEDTTAPETEYTTIGCEDYKEYYDDFIVKAYAALDYVYFPEGLNCAMITVQEQIQTEGCIYQFQTLCLLINLL